MIKNEIITPTLDPGVSPDPYKGDPGADTTQPGQSSWWDNFLSGLRTYFNFGSGGPIAGQGSGNRYDTAIAGVGSQPDLNETANNSQALLEFLQGDNTAVAQPNSSAKGSISLDSLFGSSAKSLDPQLMSYYNLYQQTGNEAYLEKMIDMYNSLQSVQSAREWEKMMSDTSYSRAFEDMKNAGYNPWLLLQNGSSGAGSYSTSSAGSPSGSASSLAVSEANNKRSVSAEITGSVIRALSMIAILAVTKGFGAKAVAAGGVAKKITTYYH